MRRFTRVLASATVLMALCGCATTHHQDFNYQSGYDTTTQSGGNSLLRFTGHMYSVD